MSAFCFSSSSTQTCARVDRPGTRPLSGVRVQRLRLAMGTWVAIEATAATGSVAFAAIDSACRAITDVERSMRPRGEGSDLARINSAAPGTRVPIADSTWHVLRLGWSVHALSEGAFDPCLPSQPGRLPDLTLSAPDAGSRWALCRVPLALDLGGIAKGYAIDRAIAALLAAGCSGGLVNAGGDLRVYGRAEDVLLRRADGTYTPLGLENAALAVSDLELDARQRPVEHQGYYCRSGPLSPRQRYAAVVAPRAAIADALTKCVLLCEPETADAIVRALGGRVLA